MATVVTSEIVVASGPDTIESVSALDFSHGMNVAWLSHDGPEEFVAFQNGLQGDGELTLQGIARGCLDTAPTAFPAGTRVWFISYGSQVLNVRDPMPPTEAITNRLGHRSSTTRSTRI